MMSEKNRASDGVGVTLIARSGLIEIVSAPVFTFDAECIGPDGQIKWRESFHNLVTTAGKNDLLDKYFSGSSYTAAWYLGLIDAAGYTAIAAGDTMASHAGWVESTAYGNANRPAISFAAASGGSKATSVAVSFNINATATLKGAFTTTNNTKGGTSGILYSAGLFSGGDRAVSNGDTLNVSGTWSV